MNAVKKGLSAKEIVTIVVSALEVHALNTSWHDSMPLRVNHA